MVNYIGKPRKFLSAEDNQFEAPERGKRVPDVYGSGQKQGLYPTNIIRKSLASNEDVF